MTTETPTATTETAHRRCAQCGRAGVRNFKTYPPGPDGQPALTICANKQACRKRWPKQYADEA